MIISRSIIAIPPGATIKEQLKDRGMSQKEFAIRMELSEKHISKLINGEVQLTPDVAVRLEMVLGIPSSFWNNLEALYRDKCARAKAENEMDEDIEFSKNFPYAEMAKNGWVPKTSKPTEKVFNLRKFFEVVQLTLLQKETIPGVVYRCLSENKKSDYVLLAWAQKAKLEARNIETKPINIEKLIKLLPEIRKMTIEDPSVFCPKLITSLSDCGIALVFLPHIGGSFLHGATFFDNNKIVMGLTVRGKDADRFWFSLFHEIGHVKYGHINQSNETNGENEKSADEFAQEILIPSIDYNEFISKTDFSQQSIIAFSSKINIDPGIVVGRLQKENYIKYSWHNNLKTKYTISE